MLLIQIGSSHHKNRALYNALLRSKVRIDSDFNSKSFTINLFPVTELLYSRDQLIMKNVLFVALALGLMLATSCQSSQASLQRAVPHQLATHSLVKS
jgi:hypothetical protein